MAKLQITYSRSAIGYEKSQKLTIKALGFHRLNETLEHDDTKVIRGMVKKVEHLVTVREVK